MARWMLVLVLVLAAACVMGQAPKKRLLVVGAEQGYRHESVSHAMAVLERMGLETGEWETVLRTDTEPLTKKKLEYNAPNLVRFDAVVLFTGGRLPMDAGQKADLLAYVKEDGRGIVAIHGAAITWTDWPEFVEMIGGTFDEHPWGTFEAPVIVEDKAFPGMQGWPEWFTTRDEIYQMKSYSREKVRVLMRLDAAKLDLKNKNVHRTDGDFAVSWARMYGKGRVFYTTLGHPVEVWDRAEMRQMMRGAIRWAMGLEEADVAPRGLR